MSKPWHRQKTDTDASFYAGRKVAPLAQVVTLGVPQNDGER